MSIEIVDGVPPEFLRATEKAIPEEQWDQFAEQARGMYKQMARISITPTWARVFDFGAGRLPGFLLRLVEESAAAGNG